ncbi:NAD(P)H-dependent oxidoreductase [Paraburkholderia sp. LEh10]|uniref:FMN-dependent NADH-azoreductase n=1 Tax=Paraburkholderia sp. LEh10 TaxID=2821353 RepID=UPI001AEAEF18|nr:NAD(P)H-dependent oxidoreductase [Paraburkholderia sp. LEh10]MBP0589703.1 NAD(P)H-dependent oxidoreductase [Paraburkholderia sp. LEh10]
MNSLKLLLLDCSPRRENSTSRHFTQHLLPALSARLGRDIQITRRNLGVEPLEAISAEYADSLVMPAAAAKERFGDALALSDELIEELDQADILWISTPVYNFTVPGVLKNWIDLVVRRDVTFTTTETGKVGLLRDRPTFVAVTSGGAMFREPALQPDFFRPYLTAVLGVIGIEDITYVPATGLAFADEPLSVVQTKAAQWLREDQAVSGV